MFGVLLGQSAVTAVQTDAAADAEVVPLRAAHQFHVGRPCPAVPRVVAHRRASEDVDAATVGVVLVAEEVVLVRDEAQYGQLLQPLRNLGPQLGVARHLRVHFVVGYGRAPYLGVAAPLGRVARRLVRLAEHGVKGTIRSPRTLSGSVLEYIDLIDVPENIVKNFEEGKYNILIATDVVARGIDFTEVSHVINMSPPENPIDYIHRIGRTGRADKDGVSLLLVAPYEENLYAEVRTVAGENISECEIPDGVEVSSLLLEEEKPTVSHKIYLKAPSLKNSGGAFHERSDKRKKVNSGGLKAKAKRKRGK